MIDFAQLFKTEVSFFSTQQLFRPNHLPLAYTFDFWCMWTWTMILSINVWGGWSWWTMDMAWKLSQNYWTKPSISLQWALDSRYCLCETWLGKKVCDCDCAGYQACSGIDRDNSGKEQCAGPQWPGVSSSAFFRQLTPPRLRLRLDISTISTISTTISTVWCPTYSSVMCCHVDILC